MLSCYWSGDKKEGFGGAGLGSVRNASGESSAWVAPSCEPERSHVTVCVSSLVKTLIVAELDDYFLEPGAKEGEDQPVSIAEYLQRSDTAVIYPEAPEEQRRRGTPELPGQDRQHGGERARASTPTCFPL